MNSTKTIPVLAVSLVLLLFLFSFGCTSQPPAQGNNTTLVLGGANKTLTYGDFAAVDYILQAQMQDPITNKTSLTVIDTSIASVAAANNISNPQRNYAPMLVNMTANNGLLNGFTLALNLMKEGENKTFTLSPADGYGVYDQKKVFSIPKTYTETRFDQVPVAYFLSKNASYAVGTILTSSYWNATVMNVTNETVIIKYMPEANQTFLFNGLPEQVVSFDDENMTVQLTLDVGSIYTTETPSGTPMNVLVVAVNDTNVTLDANHPLAGKDLTFTVFVRQIKKAA